MVSSLFSIVLFLFSFVTSSYFGGFWVVADNEDPLQSKNFVLTLDQSNFTNTIGKHAFVVVEFYAPWCGHCKELAPEYEKAASILSNNDPPVALATVDAFDVKNQDLVSEYEINSFPTLKIIRDKGKTVEDYKGPRDVERIVAYLKKQSGPASTEIKSTEDANGLIDGDDIVIAMLFLNFSSNTLSAFESKYHDIANEHKGKGISFLMGDVEATHAFQFFGLKEDDVPAMVINKDKHKYVKPNVEPDHLEFWMKEYKDGKVAPYVKSEPVPEANNQPVKVVVADSFYDIVFKSGKNVLLEFYAPWCGHCEKLVPILNEVASSFANDDDVVIAKIDATANDIVHEGFDIKGYPTLYYKSASGNLFAYDGNRTEENIIDFIKKNKDKTIRHDSRKDEL